MSRVLNQKCYNKKELLWRFLVHPYKTNASDSFIVLLSADLYSLNASGHQVALKMLETQYKKMTHDQFLDIVGRLPTSFFQKTHPLISKWILQKPISTQVWHSITPSLHSTSPFDLITEYVTRGFALLEKYDTPFSSSHVTPFLEEQAYFLTLNPPQKPSSLDISNVVKVCVSCFKKTDSLGYACHFFSCLPPTLLPLTLKELKKQGHADIAQAVVQLTKLQKTIQECATSSTIPPTQDLEALLEKISPLSEQAILSAPHAWSCWLFETEAFDNIDLIHKTVKTFAPQILPSVVSMDVVSNALPFILPDKQKCFDLFDENTTQAQKKEALSEWICCLSHVAVPSWSSVMTWVEQGKKWGVGSSRHSKINYRALVEVLSQPMTFEDKKNIEKTLNSVANHAPPSFCFAMDLSCQVLGIPSPWQGQALKPCPLTIWDKEKECCKAISPQSFLKETSPQSLEVFVKPLLRFREKACLRYSTRSSLSQEKKSHKKRRKM